MLREIKCARIWGGNENTDDTVETSAVRAALFSSSCSGGKGGDVYYFSVCGNDRLTRVAIADVVGHGERVSKTGQWLYEAVAERVDSLDGHAILSELNILALKAGYSFLGTAAVAALHRERHELYFANAGHPAIYWFSPRKKSWEMLQVASESPHANLPLGVFEDAEYSQNLYPVEPGDRLLMFTDGVLDAPNPGGEPFGSQRLAELMRNGPCDDVSCLKSHIVNNLREYTGGRFQHDDVTLMVLEVL